MVHLQQAINNWDNDKNSTGIHTYEEFRNYIIKKNLVSASKQAALKGMSIALQYIIKHTERLVYLLL
jgi:hypothetical protein